MLSLIFIFQAINYKVIKGVCYNFQYNTRTIKKKIKDIEYKKYKVFKKSWYKYSMVFFYQKPINFRKQFYFKI